MKYPLLFLFIILYNPGLLLAQGDDMRVFTVAGSIAATTLGDGAPATAAKLTMTEGVWLDGGGNIYISDMGSLLIRKVTSSTGIITTVAGNGTSGYSGDGGLATNAKINHPCGLFADLTGNIFFADADNRSIRKIDAATSNITTIAGGGTYLGDGGPATNAQIDFPIGVYQDASGDLYVSEEARIRRVNLLTGIITTIAGTGSTGLSGDGGAATNARIYFPAGLVIDLHNNLYFAERFNHRIRKVNLTSGIITTIAGTTRGYSGDGGMATDAQLSGPIGLTIDTLENIIIADTDNELIRKINGLSGIITTIAGGGTNIAEGSLAIAMQIHPQFLYLDKSGNLYFSTLGRKIFRITNYDATKSYLSSVSEVENNSQSITLSPNPATYLLHITLPYTTYTTLTITNHLGQLMLQQAVSGRNLDIDVNRYPQGIYYVALSGSEGVEVKRFVKM